MAKITKNEVSPVPPPTTWTLELSDAEARSLRAFLGGLPHHSKGANAVYNVLTHDAGLALCGYPRGDSDRG